MAIALAACVIDRPARAQAERTVPAELAQAADAHAYRKAAEGLDELLRGCEDDTSRTVVERRRLRARWFESAVAAEPGDVLLRAAAVRALKAHARDLDLSDPKRADVERRAEALSASRVPTESAPAPAVRRGSSESEVVASRLRSVMRTAISASDSASIDVRVALIDEARAALARIAVPQALRIEAAACRARIALAAGDWREGVAAAEILRPLRGAASVPSGSDLSRTLDLIEDRHWFDAIADVERRESQKAAAITLLEVRARRERRLVEAGFEAMPRGGLADGGSGMPRLVKHRRTGLVFVLIEPSAVEDGRLEAAFESATSADDPSESPGPAFQPIASPVYVGVCEVSNAAYRLVVPGHAESGLPKIDDPACSASNAAYPATAISHDEASAFCLRFGFTLPSLAEWVAVLRASHSDLDLANGAFVAAALAPRFGPLPNFWDTSAVARLRHPTGGEPFPWDDRAVVLRRATCEIGDASKVTPVDVLGNVAEWLEPSQPHQPPIALAAGGSWLTPLPATLADRARLLFARRHEADERFADVGFRPAFRIDP